MVISFPPVLFPDTLPSMDLPISATPMLTQDDLKRIAAYKAIEFVESGMVVGLGTGSTAVHAVAHIADLLRLGELRYIIGMPTSIVTANQARALGIPLSDLDRHLSSTASTARMRSTRHSTSSRAAATPSSARRWSSPSPADSSSSSTSRNSSIDSAVADSPSQLR